MSGLSGRGMQSKRALAGLPSWAKPTNIDDGAYNINYEQSQAQSERRELCNVWVMLPSLTIVDSPECLGCLLGNIRIFAGSGFA